MSGRLWRPRRPAARIATSIGGRSLNIDSRSGRNEPVFVRPGGEPRIAQSRSKGDLLACNQFAARHFSRCDWSGGKLKRHPAGRPDICTLKASDTNRHRATVRTFYHSRQEIAIECVESERSRDGRPARVAACQKSKRRQKCERRLENATRALFRTRKILHAQKCSVMQANQRPRRNLQPFFGGLALSPCLRSVTSRSRRRRSPALSTIARTA